MLKSLWKRYWKITFAHRFDHNLWFTKNFLVIFISLEIRYPGLQFEHKYFLILTYIEWVMTVWNLAYPVIKIGVLGDIYVCMQRCVHTLCSRTSENQFLGPKASLFRSNHNLKVLKSLWKRCWKMTFAYYFDHNFWSTK